MVHTNLQSHPSPLGQRGLPAQAGFTLIELIVVIAILTLVTGLILANNTAFGGKILLENFAYDVALSVREAQVYGISVRQFGQGNFAAGYGVHFSRSTPTTFVLFADASNPDGLYEDCGGAPSCELVESTDIQRGFYVADLEVGAEGAEVPATTLDILFKRPEPDAYISADGISGIAQPGALKERARIVLESPRGDIVSVVVEATGQISVE